MTMKKNNGGSYNGPIALSVLIPTRGRPDSCLATLKSFEPVPDNVEIILGIDDDDATRERLIAAVSGIKGVRAIVGPRFDTLAMLLNALYVASVGKYVLAFCDDYEIGIKNYADIILESAKQLPLGYGVLYLHDPSHPDFSSIFCLSRKTVEVNDGHFSPPWFPFWFGDTWWDEIGDMMDAKIAVPIEVKIPQGRGETQGLCEVYFWAELFHATRPMRGGVARKMIALAYDEAKQGEIVEGLPLKGKQLFAKTEHLLHPQFIRQFDAKQSGSSERYDRAKRAAEEFRAGLQIPMPQKRISVAVCVPSGGHWTARMANSVAAMTAFSAQAGIAISALALEGSMITKQRNDIVEMAKKAGADYVLQIDSDLIFPPDTLMRLLSHQKDIVGATYCKKFPPYECLGRLLPKDGKVPDAEEFKQGGLWPALMLPGGMMLIKMDVFDKMGWPWYFESYKWPGTTGSEALGYFLSNNLAKMPPKEVLESIKDTALGQWIDDAWKVEAAAEWQYFSEDLNFCRRADRAGYTLWCDLGLSFELKHVGLHEVAMRASAEQVSLTDLHPEIVQDFMERRRQEATKAKVPVVELPSAAAS
jgi:hypothetical protein